jgi:hypothetical protein
LKNHVAPNELEIGFVTLGNMRANGVRTLAAWCLVAAASTVVCSGRLGANRRQQAVLIID